MSRSGCHYVNKYTGVNKSLRLPESILLRILLADMIQNSEIGSGTHENQESVPSGKGIKEWAAGRRGWGEVGVGQLCPVPEPPQVCEMEREEVLTRAKHPQGPWADVLGKYISCWSSASRFSISLGGREHTQWGAGALGSNHLCRDPSLITHLLGIVTLASVSWSVKWG